MSDRPITLAVIVGAHGVTGEVRVKLFGSGLDALKSHKSLIGRRLTHAKNAGNSGPMSTSSS